MLKPLPVDWSAADASISVLTFIAHAGFTTHELAHMLDSLVRVSRRDAEDHFESIAPAGGVPQSGPRQQACPAALTHTPVRRDTKGASGHPVYAAASTLILCSSLSAISSTF